MSATRSSSLVFLHLVSLLLLAACSGCNAFVQANRLANLSVDGTGESSFNNDMEIQGSVSPNYASVSNPFEASPASANREAADADPSSTAPPTESKRKMIYTARFEIATIDVNETIDRFVESMNSIGGYLQSQNNNRVVMRVPADWFDKVVENMASLGEVLSQSIQNEDVTRQYRNIGLRVEALATARRRILTLLEGAENLEYVLKLEEQRAS